LPFGHVFFSIAFITAVVAMCTHQVNRGLALLISSFVASGLCVLIFFTLVIGTIGIAAAPAIRQADADLRKMQAAQTQALQQMNRARTQLQPNLSALKPHIAPLSPATTQSFPFVSKPASDDQRQHELAMAQRRDAEARTAADKAKRDQNVRDAERHRDAAKGKEQRLNQLQASIDNYDRFVRDSDPTSGGGKYFREQRDALLREKAKLQGY
jgi:hypothetical protein